MYFERKSPTPGSQKTINKSLKPQVGTLTAPTYRVRKHSAGCSYDKEKVGPNNSFCSCNKALSLGKCEAAQIEGHARRNDGY